MARNVQINSLVGTYIDGTDIYPILLTTLAAQLSTVGITGNGLPRIAILQFNGTSDAALTIKLSPYSSVTALQNINSDMQIYTFCVGTSVDEFHVPVQTMLIQTCTPSASATIRLNYYYEPVNATLL